LPAYQANVREILAYLSARTDHLVVCTTTTAAHAPQTFRSEADVLRYNLALTQEAGRVRATLCDLYSLTAAHPEWYAPGEVHPYGHYQQIAPAVAQAMLAPPVPALSTGGCLVLLALLPAFAARSLRRVRGRLAR
jgi:hypothetical protein